ncbi:MAG: HAD family hydrolase [Deltaproteobacteria bacterium]|nr:HAD family hydrolase [Deltaproteobacteria bacterium]
MSSQRHRPLQALLLDAGNTLVFVDLEVMAAILAELGHSVDVAALRRAQRTANQTYVRTLRSGAGHEDGWQRFMSSWIGTAGVAADDVDHAVVGLRAVHDEFNLWRKVPPGLVDTLAELRAAGVALGVVSNSEGHIDDLFARVGLDRTFDVIVDSALEGVRKPDPEIFHRACRRLSVEPSRSLYAGDIPEVDVVGAHRAGLEAVLIDPFGLYRDYRDAPRYASVVELARQLLSERASKGRLHTDGDET